MQFVATHAPDLLDETTGLIPCDLLLDLRLARWVIVLRSSSLSSLMVYPERELWSAMLTETSLPRLLIC